MFVGYKLQRYIKKRNIFVFLLGLLLCFVKNTSYAAYDVVRATTEKEYSNSKLIDADEFEDVTSDEVYEGTYKNSVDVQDDLYSLLEKKIRKIFKKNSDIDEDENDIQTDIKEEEVVEDDKNASKENISEADTTQNIENAENVENKFQINADKVTYDDEEGNVYADGHVEIISYARDVKLKADNAILDKTAQTLTLKNNVKIIKDGSEMRGEYLVVDLNEQNILMDNPTLEAYSFLITAQEGYLVANDIQMVNGNIRTAANKEFPLVTNGFLKIEPTYKTDFIDKYVFPDDDSYKNRQAYKIDSKEILVTNYKDHTSLVLKGSNVFFNNHKIARNADIEIITDKSHQVVELNTPEIGNLRGFGTYFGYGAVFRMPKGHTLKFMPVLTYKDGVGIGAIARYRTQQGIIEGGWNTSSETLVARARLQLTENLGFTAARNAYIPDGIFGANRPGLGAQLQYIKSYKINDLKASFSNGIYAGIFSEYENDGKYPDYTTTRFRYIGQLSKSFYTYKNKEQDFEMILKGIAQGAATVYGSGETHGLVRVGPQLVTRYKRWEQNLGYFLTGQHGESPFRFDEYRYGKSTITLNEKFYITNKLAFGFRIYLTPLEDNIHEDFLTECRFYVMVGPPDLKLALSYDFVRDIAHMDFMFLLGSQNSRINFDKLTTKDIDDKQEKRDFYKYAKPVKIEKPENI